MKQRYHITEIVVTTIINVIFFSRRRRCSFMKLWKFCIINLLGLLVIFFTVFSTHHALMKYSSKDTSIFFAFEKAIKNSLQVNQSHNWNNETWPCISVTNGTISLCVCSFYFFLIAREILTSAFNLHDFPTDLEFWLKKFFIFVLVLDTWAFKQYCSWNQYCL